MGLDVVLGVWLLGVVGFGGFVFDLVLFCLFSLWWSFGGVVGFEWWVGFVGSGWVGLLVVWISGLGGCDWFGWFIGLFCDLLRVLGLGLFLY